MAKESIDSANITWLKTLGALPNKFWNSLLRYFKSISSYDLKIVGLVISFVVIRSFSENCLLAESVCLPVYEIFSKVTEDNAKKFGIYTVFLLFLSTLIRHATKDTKNKSWRYMAIMAFSIVGSVIVALITHNEPLSIPFIWALAITLLHLGYWCWSREYIETSSHQTQIRATTLSLEHMIKIMPKEGAFNLMGESTSYTFSTLSMLTKMAIFANNDNDDDKKSLTAELAKEQIRFALSAMCQIAALWTVSNARLFEANIMLLKSSKDASTIPNAEEAFERGSIFFPDISALESLHLSCEKCLYVVPELAINDGKTEDEVNLKPLMLPVGLKSKMHAGRIKGAPEAAETGNIVSVSSINEILDNLPPNYVAEQKDKIRQYFNGQPNCGSILSIPLTIELSNESSGPLRVGEKLSVNSKSVNAVINLYRPEEGSIKSPELFREFTKPLVLMIANLLYLYTQFKTDLPQPNKISLGELSSDTLGIENLSGNENEQE